MMITINNFLKIHVIFQLSIPKNFFLSRAIKQDLSKCVKNFIKRCGTPLHKEVSDLIVDQIDNSISRFCDPNNPQRHSKFDCVGFFLFHLRLHLR